jgi:GMP synthase-like glutamine amidotransferase
VLNVLALIHGENVRPGIFADVVRDRGHHLEEWSFMWGRPLPRDAFDAVMVFGGSMHPDQDDAHPWLAEELEFLRETDLPTFGVCLGAQLLARAFGGRVFEAPDPEIGWHEVELLGVEDPVLGALPERFTALQHHYYTYEVPADAVELARSARCTQAFRLGDRWAVQFHPEVTRWHVERWAADDGLEVSPETDVELPRWQELGARLCDAFLDYSTGRSARLDQSCQEPA